MGNVFLLYMPPGNAQAMVHYEDTIKRRVTLAQISEFISHDLRARLTTIFPTGSFAVWGSEAGPRNQTNFDRMTPGDDVLIVEGDTIKLIGKVAAKTVNEELSRQLWRPLTHKQSATWSLIYFIANPRELNLPFKEFCRLFGYALSYRLRGFASISAERLIRFRQQYDDLYSVLVRIQKGQPVARRNPENARLLSQMVEEEGARSGLLEDEIPTGELISDHVRMQWTLARLGLKAGERVWVPQGDQRRLRDTYRFDSFDSEFTSGIDLPHSYVENIDVVWKQEFRIGAAYEIENTTSIYSGLLRFADLNILAPNTLYPMFVVAPNDRRNRVREQLRRPTFRQLELDKKVRFLSYESIKEIDSFFAESDSGLSVDLVIGKSELIV